MQSKSYITYENIYIDDVKSIELDDGKKNIKIICFMRYNKTKAVNCCTIHCFLSENFWQRRFNTQCQDEVEKIIKSHKVINKVIGRIKLSIKGNEKKIPVLNILLLGHDDEHLIEFSSEV